MANISPVVTTTRQDIVAVWSLTAGGTDTGVAVFSRHARRTFQCILTGAGTLIIESSNDDVTYETEDTITASVGTGTTPALSYGDSAKPYWRCRQTAGTGTWVVTASFQGVNS